MGAPKRLLRPGDPAARFASNGELVWNAIDNLGGSNGLISIRGRAIFASANADKGRAAAQVVDGVIMIVANGCRIHLTENSAPIEQHGGIGQAAQRRGHRPIPTYLSTTCGCARNNFFGQVILQPFANNGELVWNAIDNLGSA